MNYLAHIFLSSDDRRLQIGNFIADAVKGSSFRSYPQGIAEGILLHRAIDSYTDSHPLVRQTVHGLKPLFGRYSGVLLDIYFDYFLASRFDRFSELSLRRFTRKFYFRMIITRKYLPPRIKRFMWHFIWSDRLGRYATTEGIAQSLSIMVDYGRAHIDVEMAIDYLKANEQGLYNVFCEFFPQLQSLCDGYLTSGDRALYLRQLREGEVPQQNQNERPDSEA